MLLFALGVDLSLKRVLASARKIVSAGLVQMILTIGSAWLIASQTGLANNAAAGLLFGCVCAISSSVVISKILMDRGEQESFHGQILIPLSLVQDLCLVAIIPFLPILQMNNANFNGVIISSAKAAFFLLAVFIGSIKLVPWALARAANSNSRELFLLSLLVLCLGIALFSSSLGLSLALGAFIAGIMICESSYAHQALHDVAPLRDVFSSVFFVSVGMLLDPSYIAQHWMQVLIFVFALIIGKTALGTVAALCASSNLRTAFLVGLGLAQIGEFSFVLLTLGHDSHIITDAMYNLFFAGAVITMISSPALMAFIPKVLLKIRNAKFDNEPIQSYSTAMENHVILCGYGRIGQNLGKVLKDQSLPFIAIELNANIIEDLAISGVKHIYGDAMSLDVMKKANIAKAKALVLTMPDPLTAAAVADFAKKSNPEITIIARAHRSDDIEIFRDAGVNGLVQPEFEASVEITRLVLHSMNCPMSAIQESLAEIRTRRYAIFQPDIKEIEEFVHSKEHQDKMGLWFRVKSENLAGKSIKTLDIRNETGATITAVKRGNETFSFPNPDFKLSMSDEIYAVGQGEQLEKLAISLNGKNREKEEAR